MIRFSNKLEHVACEGVVRAICWQSDGTAANSSVPGAPCRMNGQGRNRDAAAENGSTEDAAAEDGTSEVGAAEHFQWHRMGAHSWLLSCSEGRVLRARFGNYSYRARREDRWRRGRVRAGGADAKEH